MLNFWNLIVESNTFNFAVLVVILVMVWQKADLSSKLDDLRISIIGVMEKSKLVRLDAEKSLYDAQNAVKNLDKEIANEIDLANSRAENVVASIENTVRESIGKLEKNVSTVIENEAYKINNTLLNDAIDKAIAQSEEILRTKFKASSNLHKQYIDISLKMLDKIEIK